MTFQANPCRHYRPWGAHGPRRFGRFERKNSQETEDLREMVERNWFWRGYFWNVPRYLWNSGWWSLWYWTLILLQRWCSSRSDLPHLLLKLGHADPFSGFLQANWRSLKTCIPFGYSCLLRDQYLFLHLPWLVFSLSYPLVACFLSMITINLYLFMLERKQNLHPRSISQYLSPAVIDMIVKIG